MWFWDSPASLALFLAGFAKGRRPKRFGFSTEVKARKLKDRNRAFYLRRCAFAKIWPLWTEGVVLLLAFARAFKEGMGILCLVHVGGFMQPALASHLRGICKASYRNCPPDFIVDWGRCWISKHNGRRKSHTICGVHPGQWVQGKICINAGLQNTFTKFSNDFSTGSEPCNFWSLVFLCFYQRTSKPRFVWGVRFLSTPELFVEEPHWHLWKASWFKVWYHELSKFERPRSVGDC